MPIAVTEPLIDRLSELCAKHHVTRLRLFGSTVAGTDRPDSDVDLLVDYEPGHSVTLRSLTEFESDLQNVFDGRAIDLVQPALLHWFIRDSVLASARTLYER